MKTWVVACNSSRARIFELEKGLTLLEVETLVDPEARLHERDMVTDKSGRSFPSAGSGSDAMGASQSAKEHDREIFAKLVAAHLNAAGEDSGYDRLYLASSPQFLGVLRKMLGKRTLEMLRKEVNKDLTELQPAEIGSHFPFSP